MGEHDVGFALLPELERGAGADGDRLQGVAGLFLEQRRQRVEQPGIRGGGRGRQDDVLGTGARYRRRCALGRKDRGPGTKTAHEQEHEDRVEQAAHRNPLPDRAYSRAFGMVVHNDSKGETSPIVFAVEF